MNNRKSKSLQHQNNGFYAGKKFCFQSQLTLRLELNNCFVELRQQTMNGCSKNFEKAQVLLFFRICPSDFGTFFDGNSVDLELILKFFLMGIFNFEEFLLVF